MNDVEFTNFKLSDIDKEIIEKDKIKYKKKKVKRKIIQNIICLVILN